MTTLEYLSTHSAIALYLMPEIKWYHRVADRFGRLLAWGFWG